ncbi:MAG: PilT/PilU family type 4a pilus ATPase [Dehalococcoidia bacterium]|jgi:twitching motility protein PilT|nr:PilT/PilU family type 4a pilus ATPase [Dehalococcoidia bacterium]
MSDIFELLRLAKRREASDLHLVVGSPPMARIDGALQLLDGYGELTPEDVQTALTKMTSPDQQAEFATNLELDFGMQLPEVGRLRCNAARQRGHISFAIRLLPVEIPTIDGLELPEVYKELAMKQHGLVIASGPTGSGKSTSLATIVNHINHHRTCHVVTIEDPIEYTHTNIKSAITQRQLGTDTLSFATALKHVLRQDPDVILVGEMRDLETAQAAITVAETGHLVLTTGHATGAPEAIDRVVGLFPPAQRYLAQIRLAATLIAVLGQTLIPRASGTGRVAAVEIMLGNSAVKNLVREGKIHQLHNVIRTSSRLGMMTMDQSLAKLYVQGTISAETLLTYAQNRDEVEEIAGTRLGRVASY